MDLQNLKGIGDKTISALYKNNIYNLSDLLFYYPYRYQIEEPTSLTCFHKNDTITINAIVKSVSKVGYIKKNLNVFRIRAINDGIEFNIVIYNRAFLKPNLKVGQNIIVTGKYDSGKRIFTASNIRFGVLDTKRIIPVYHSVKNIKPLVFSKIMNEALLEMDDIVDYIPSFYQENSSA